jgi:hypothetical protein
MNTAYFGDTSSLLYPPSYSNHETALDHAVALYSINSPVANGDTTGRESNRIYLGWDAIGACVMRNFTLANPLGVPGANLWTKSDDIGGPHPPFTQREMIFWYRPWWDPSSQGPQFHLWAKDADFSQDAIDARYGVCGISDRSLTEATIAFSWNHVSNPLVSYTQTGGYDGYGWQIVDHYLASGDAGWSYTPTGCPVTPPCNTDPNGGGTWSGLGPLQLDGGACTAPKLGDAGGCH